ncbi:unnamed protein product, partial [Staurois parvus]
WYKAVVNSPVQCDLCDHSQISHIVSNDVRSDILLTPIHVITVWPISDHMIGTSYRGPVQGSEDTVGTGSQCRVLPGSAHWLKMRAPFINGTPLLHCSRPAVFVHGPDGKWLN